MWAMCSFFHHRHHPRNFHGIFCEHRSILTSNKKLLGTRGLTTRSKRTLLGAKGIATNGTKGIATQIILSVSMRRSAPHLEGLEELNDVCVI